VRRMGAVDHVIGRRSTRFVNGAYLLKDMDGSPVHIGESLL